MLVSKPISYNDIVCLKLISGEEIIGRFEHEHTDVVEISKPLAVTLGPNGLGMVPWLFLGGRDLVKIKQSHILALVECKKDAADQYRSSTSDLAIGNL
ncbi:MAG: hypothetical protein EBU90_07880 [Proteobacteria bacterium]|nr:hypothetical protein [Pseudomonadota bacterium]NBP14119.1 hypothetical protein [bacterium]